MRGDDENVRRATGANEEWRVARVRQNILGAGLEMDEAENRSGKQQMKAAQPELIQEYFILLHTRKSSVVEGLIKDSLQV